MKGRSPAEEMKHGHHKWSLSKSLHPKFVYVSLAFLNILCSFNRGSPICFIFLGRVKPTFPSDDYIKHLTVEK